MREANWHVAARARLGQLELDVTMHGGARPLALIGPNGAGKTSLLRMVAGALRPREGRIEIAGRPLFDAQRGIDVPPEQRRVGFVPQGYGLFPHLRVIDNVAFGLAASGRLTSQRRERRRAAQQALARLDCGQLAHRFPAELSGGEQQRIALARTLVTEPTMLLLDEPLAAMDAGARRRLRRALAAHLGEQKCPAIVVTHDVRDVMALNAEVCVLDKGRVVQTGDLETLRAAPCNDFVAEFTERLPETFRPPQ